MVAEDNDVFFDRDGNRPLSAEEFEFFFGVRSSPRTPTRPIRFTGDKDSFFFAFRFDLHQFAVEHRSLLPATQARDFFNGQRFAFFEFGARFDTVIARACGLDVPESPPLGLRDKSSPP